MKNPDWLGKDEGALERLLVERWLFRGGLLVVMLFSAILVTWVGIRGVTTWADTLTVGAIVALGLAAGILAFVMRLVDRRIHLEIRRRRQH